MSQTESIANELRDAIQRGELRPGEKLPSSNQLADERGLSAQVVRSAFRILVQDGLVRTVKGSGTYVRDIPPEVLIEPHRRYLLEKTRLLDPDPEALRALVAEMDSGIERSKVHVTSAYSIVTPPPALAKALGISPSSKVLEREYTTTLTRDEYVSSIVRSYIPVTLLEANADLLDETKEPWPGGTMAQLGTVGVEVGSISVSVKAGVATTTEAAQLGITRGEAVLRSQKVSYDTKHRVVELADVLYPAGDQTVFRFEVDLPSFEDLRTQ